MNDKRRTSSLHGHFITTTADEMSCNGSMFNLTTGHYASLAKTEYIDDKITYLEKALGFLIIGLIGIFSNLFAIFILGSSRKMRQKLINTLIIHQSFVDLLASIALISMAHIDGTYQRNLEGLQAEIFCFFVNCKLPLWLMIDVSSFNLMFLNIERYISIVFPIYHHTKVTRKKVLLFLP